MDSYLKTVAEKMKLFDDFENKYFSLPFDDRTPALDSKYSELRNDYLMACSSCCRHNLLQAKLEDILNG